MKIAFIRNPEKGRVRIGVGEGEDVRRYLVSEGLLDRLGLVRGYELGDEEMALIEADEASYRCMRRALSLLSFGDNTRAQLTAKLLRSGFCRETVEDCVAECLRLGYIDERRQIERAVLNEANRALRGRGYILRKLASKGYRPAEVAEVIDELCLRGEVDFARSFERLCEKRGAYTDEERNALMYKQGYRSTDFD